MKQNHDLEDLFSVLEHADEETLLHIAEHYPLADKKQIEEVFAMSEKKYQAGTDFTNPAEEETYQVQITRSTGWYKSVIGAVACLAVTVGAVSAVANMKRVPPEPDFSVAESIETETISETYPETKISEMSRKYSETTVKSVQNTETPAETVTTAVSETIPAVITTAVQSQTITETTRTTTTQTVPEAIQEEEVSVPEPETLYIPEAIAETIPEAIEETQPVPEETQPVETLILASGTYYLTKADYEYVPGFVAKSYDGPEIECNGDVSKLPYDVLYPMLDGTESNNFDVEYAPTYLPDETYFLSQNMADSPRKCRSLIYSANPNGWNKRTEFAQFTKPTYKETLFTRQAEGETYYLAPLDIIEINGHAGWIENLLGGYILTWDGGDYIMRIQSYTLSLEEIIKMAESVQPVQ
ncbi:MAG: DUF4367 domain-containing protein [Oscillospiraceae bacterium]|nr:DUF4367 domain-containing protein [Oscillospiraceae bacterium]